MSHKKKSSKEVQGLIRLISDGTIGISNLVEAMQDRILYPPFLPSSALQDLLSKIAGISFENIRWSTRLISQALEKVAEQLAPVLGEIEDSEIREALIAILNGVIGDYLEDQGNPLQISMQLRHSAKAIPRDRSSLRKAYPKANGRILLMVHGSCMNDIQWTRKEHNHGLALAKELDMTLIYLHYNSGRHISSNGQELNTILEELQEHWPLAIEELNIIAHSMGGLVARSALHYGQKQQKTWPKHLKKIIFLGTPHHGAPLEQAGNYLDVVLEAIPYAKPFARLGKIRSAGLTDLRYGNLIDEDWQGKDRFEMGKDPRQTIPLAESLSAYCIAATMSSEGESEAKPDFLKGDGLVEVNSALGKHRDPARNLAIKAENTWIAYQSLHLDLLSQEKVYTKIKEWLL